MADADKNEWSVQQFTRNAHHDVTIVSGKGNGDFLNFVVNVWTMFELRQ